MVVFSKVLFLSATLFAVGKAAVITRATNDSAASVWNGTNTEALMSVLGADGNLNLGTGYPVSCDSDCNDFAETFAANATSGLASELGSTTDTNTSAPLCVSSFYSNTKKCANCIIKGNSTSTIATFMTSYVPSLAAGCGTTISLAGAAASITGSLDWAPVIGLAFVAGIASLL